MDRGVWQGCSPCSHTSVGHDLATKQPASPYLLLFSYEVTAKTKRQGTMTSADGTYKNIKRVVIWSLGQGLGEFYAQDGGLTGQLG